MTGGIYILLGSNQGDKRKNINDAIKLVIQEAGKIVNRSCMYQTAAWGKENQPDFINIVVELETILKPAQLLAVLLKIEKQLRRVRRAKWEETVIDIDILYYKDWVVNYSNLKIPHPEIHNRRFTLVPLVEIAADFLHPILNKSNSFLLNECLDQLAVQKIE